MKYPLKPYINRDTVWNNTVKSALQAWNDIFNYLSFYYDTCVKNSFKSMVNYENWSSCRWEMRISLLISYKLYSSIFLFSIKIGQIESV